MFDTIGQHISLAKSRSTQSLGLGNRSFRQRVSSPTYEVDSVTSNVSSPTLLNYRIQGHFFPYTHINYSSFFHPRAIQLIPRSFIHCRAKRKSILNIGSQSDWHISVGELTFDVGESTSSVGELVVGELVVGELTRWRNDRYSLNLLCPSMISELFRSIFIYSIVHVS